MKRLEIIEKLKRQLSKERLLHTLGVEETAKILAMHYDVDANKASLAALLHDCAKGFPPNSLLKKAESSGIIIDELERLCPDLLHGPVGAVLAREDYGIEDSEILTAIAVHTTGAEEMSELDKIVYIADYIEPNRSFSGVERLREAAWKDLDWCMSLCFDQTIFYLIKEKKLIHPKTIAARNTFLLNDRAGKEKTHGGRFKEKPKKEGQD